MRASGWALGLLPLLLLLPGAEGQIQVCSVDPEEAQVSENVPPPQTVAKVTAPPGKTVVLSPNTNPIFKMENGELKLVGSPDYETDPVLIANLECKEGDIVVTKLIMTVLVLNVNDEPPLFPFSSKIWNVSENTIVGTTVIPATELTATDKDGDPLFYTLLGQSPPGADKVFSLAGVNFPALQLEQTLDYEKMPSMVFHLLVRDTEEPEAKPSHTATASITIQVIPSDMRPPWFLPCRYTDGRICFHAEYRGAVPIGYVLTSPCVFLPGPVYAVDGDAAINEPIRYSIIGGNEDNTFQIGEDSGNVTMTKAVPVSMSFNLLVQAQQQVHTGSYSVTQVTIYAVPREHPPRFPRALYRGWLPPGTGLNVAVKDAEDPDRELKLSAEDLDFPSGVPNLGLEYRITNSSAFRMSGEVVLTSVPVGPPGVLYLEAEVLDRLTKERDTTTIEVLIQDTRPTPPESTTPDSETSPASSSTPTRPPTQTLPHPDTTVKPSGGPPTQNPSGPGPTQGPPHPDTTVKPSATPPSQGSPGPSPNPTQTSPHPDTTVKPSLTQNPSGPGPSGGSQTETPGEITGGPTPEPGVSATTSPGAIGPSRPTGGSSGGKEQRRFTASEMAATGGVLGALLFLTLILLGVFVYKYYRDPRESDLSSKPGTDLKDSGYENKAFQAQEAAGGGRPPSPSPSPSPEPGPLARAPPGGSPRGSLRGPAPAAEAEAPSPALAEPEEKAEAGGSGGERPVRSILTKERKSEGGGYKAVWFGEDIGAQVDVVVINSPAPEEPPAPPHEPTAQPGPTSSPR
ncbi:cadherin-related family member 5 [Sminthopsis crassicaudata]|uniref:cadherin-related family member 5 n=1 Tax=Sminthopsis crassicaudata TaxID=9301 RepID=UPI003D692BB6